MNRQRLKKWFPYVLLGILTLFFCWLFCGRLGVFGAKVDWISQHSVLPDYFRQQFYETGQLFPEFAANIGGGQNIYNFAYYGLYSPIVLISYLLPFVKMSDYMIVASVLSLLVAVFLFYKWLLKRGITKRISFWTTLMFLLAGPMIYHSYNQIMFVNYMPFLCLAFLGVDRYFEKGKTGLYTISVFLMILTSFYFSIGGMLVLVLYGIYRYFERKEGTSFLLVGAKFLLPMLTAVLMSAVLLLPTAMALIGGREGAEPVKVLELLIPNMRFFQVVYAPYGIGLTTLMITVLITGITYRKWCEKFLHAACILILILPVFAYFLNGGLYIRDKVFIPFLPLFCYLIACYMEKQKNGEIPFWKGMVPFLLTIVLLYVGHEQGTYSQYVGAVILDAVVMLGSGLIFYWKKREEILLIVPVGILAVYGVVLHASADKMLEPSFYRAVTDVSIQETIDELTEKEKGFYRMEQRGTTEQNAANLNRIWNMDQYISSIYSSSYNADYQEFRTENFLVEQPFRNVLMQSVTENPIYQRLMGVKYRISEHGEIFENENVFPMIYVTNRMISEKEYKHLVFPYNQLALSEFAVGKSVKDGQAGNVRELFESQEKEVEIELPVGKNKAVKKTAEGYRIRSKTIQNMKLEFGGMKDANVLFMQFEVRNYKQSKDVSVWLEGVKNKLTANSHIYYNDNTTFTYAIHLQKGQTEVNLGLGAGEYEIRNLRCYLGSVSESVEALCKSEFQVDQKQTKGNRIVGRIEGMEGGYLITSIPYDEHFEVQIDGKTVEYEKVNTAFLGAQIEEGVHEVEIVYHAPGVKLGKMLSVLGVLLLAGSYGFPVRRKSYSPLTNTGLWGSIFSE